MTIKVKVFKRFIEDEQKDIFKARIFYFSREKFSHLREIYFSSFEFNLINLRTVFEKCKKNFYEHCVSRTIGKVEPETSKKKSSSMSI